MLVLESSSVSGDSRDEIGLESWRDAAEKPEKPEKEVKSESQEIQLSVSFSADRVSRSGASVSGVEVTPSKPDLVGVRGNPNVSLRVSIDPSVHFHSRRRLTLRSWGV